MYPNSAPATDLSGFWNQGSYTPLNVVAYIIDDQTPINKNAMANSVGKEISLLQNFVNSTYLGRSGTYVQDGYIRYAHIQDLVSTGYLGASTVGDIYLCSNILPKADRSVDLGAINYRFGYIYTEHIKVLSTVSGYTNLTLTANPSYNIISNRNIYPSGSLSLDLGSDSLRFNSGYFGSIDATAGFFTNLASTSWVSSVDVGNIYLCSNIVPRGGGIRLGSLTSRFGYFYIDHVYLTDPPAAANGSELWVDVSGYVRRG